ncbi:MAG: hypothetical protein H5T59_08000, partial [Anaerolineae bacterium]|nr:hypothetical protein [Anaerolineae bacterium]
MKRALVLTTILLGLVLAASTLQGAAWAAMPAPPSAGASAASQGTGHNVDLVGQMGGASLAVLGLQEPLGDRSIYSYHATVPPMLDGDLSEWQDLPVTVLDRTTADWIFGPVSNPDPANLSAEIRSMWTSTHLYFAFHVRDDHIVVDSPPPPDPDWKVWHDDEVEIGLDGDNDDAWGGAEDHQFTINPNGWKTDGGGSLTDVFQAAIVQVQGSHWDVEVAIPLDQLGGTFTEGRIIGVTFGLH